MIRSSSFLLQYFVSNDMVEAAPQPTIQMMPTNTTSASGHTIVDTQSLHGGKIRIVNNQINNDEVAAALQPTRKIITINNQQYVVSQGGQGTFFLANQSVTFLSFLWLLKVLYFLFVFEISSYLNVPIKGGFYSEGTDVFVISSNRRTLLFS